MCKDYVRDPLVMARCSRRVFQCNGRARWFSLGSVETVGTCRASLGLLLTRGRAVESGVCNMQPARLQKSRLKAYSSLRLP